VHTCVGAVSITITCTGAAEGCGGVTGKRHAKNWIPNAKNWSINVKNATATSAAARKWPAPVGDREDVADRELPPPNVRPASRDSGSSSTAQPLHHLVLQ